MTEYWFRKRKGLFKKSESPLGFDLGWGGVPISWEGWLLTLGLVLAIYFQYKAYSKEIWVWLIIDLIIFDIIADLNSREKVIFK